MQLVCYVKNEDLHFFSASSGYTKTDADQYIPSLKGFLGSLSLDYVRHFVCFSVLPNSADPNEFTTHVACFGDTPLVLRPEIAVEVMLTCSADLQTTAYNGWKRRRGKRILETYRRMIRDLSRATDEQKREHLRSLSQEFSQNSYAEARIYRAITWDDVEDDCRKRLEIGVYK